MYTRISTGQDCLIGFDMGTVSGGAGGLAGGFTAGTGQAIALQSMGYLEGDDILMYGMKGAAIGGISGAVLGGLSGGFNALGDGKTFMTGEDVAFRYQKLSVATEIKKQLATDFKSEEFAENTKIGSRIGRNKMATVSGDVIAEDPYPRYSSKIKLPVKLTRYFYKYGINDYWKGPIAHEGRHAYDFYSGEYSNLVKRVDASLSFPDYHSRTKFIINIGELRAFYTEYRFYGTGPYPIYKMMLPYLP